MKDGQNILQLVWQYPSKEEDYYTFRTTPWEHWLTGSVLGTPNLTIKKLRSAGFAPPAQFYHNKIAFTHGFISITLSTAIFITTGVYIHNRQLKHVT